MNDRAYMPIILHRILITTEAKTLINILCQQKEQVPSKRKKLKTINNSVFMYIGTRKINVKSCRYF